VVQGNHVAPRAIVMQKKTQRPVQFEITEQTREAVTAWIATARLKAGAVSLSESYVGVASLFDSTVFSDRSSLGKFDRA